MITVLGSASFEEILGYAAEQQDAGFSVCFFIPVTSDLDAIYPYLINTLDMSRVAVYTQGQLDLAVAEGINETEWRVFGVSTKRWDGTQLASLWKLSPWAITV